MAATHGPRILVVYHSGEGQTAKIADRLVCEMERAGALVTLSEASDAPPPTACEVVVVGDSIHAGHHSRKLVRWLERYETELQQVPVALFQVSLTSATEDEEHTKEALQLVQQLLDATGLDPDMVGLFAGALAYTRYGWLKRTLMKGIATHEGGDTDTSRDYEYTDWEAVDQFAADVVVLATSGTGAT